MLILWKARRKDPSAGYARTFLAQLEQVLGTALDRGIRIVTNAGGLNPVGLAEPVERLAARLGLAPKIAWIDGDDLTAGSASCWPPGTTSRTWTPAGRCAGPASSPVTAQRLPWRLGDRRRPGRGRRHRRLPAGHRRLPRRGTSRLVARLGTRPTSTRWPARSPPATSSSAARRRPAATTRGRRRSGTAGRPGYPIAEVARRRVQRDHQAPRHRRPRVGRAPSPRSCCTRSPARPTRNPTSSRTSTPSASLATAPTGCGSAARRAAPPSGQLKVAINYSGGYRNTMTLVLTGLDIESKAAAAEAQLFDALGGKERFDEVDVRLLRFDRPDAPANAQATAHLQITVKDQDGELAGRRFSDAAVGAVPRRLRGLPHHDSARRRQRVRRLLARPGPRRGRHPAAGAARTAPARAIAAHATRRPPARSTSIIPNRGPASAPRDPPGSG